MVTGKNREQFEEWYDEFTTYGTIITFTALPFEMQMGVYLAYYDYIGEIYINTSSYERGNYWKAFCNYELNKRHHTRYEAYKEAFKQADRLINEKI